MFDILENLAHVHLLLNHFPTIGFSVGLGLFLVSLFGKSEELKRASLGIFLAIAILTIPTYLSGNAAHDAIQGREGVSEALISAHETAALWAFLFMQITGFVAFLGLWQYRRVSRVPSWNLWSVLILSLLTFAVTARAANLGGEIRHPEIQSAQETAAAEAAVGSNLARSIGSFITAETWAWPTLETLHFVGLCLLFTVVLIVDLRLLGMAKRMSMSSLYQLLPFGLIGFGVNMITGMGFFLATPEQYTKNVAFYWKIVLVVLGAINVLYFIVFDEPWAVGPGEDAPMTAKVFAASAIFLWLGVLYCGHMLPFIGNSF